MINELINKYQLGLDYCYELEGRRDVITGEANFIKKPKSDCYDLIELYKRILKDLNQLKEPTICGYSAEEVITILNGLELERKLDIKMTMDNLSLLFEKLREDFHNTLKVSYDRMSKLGVDIDE